MGNFVDHVCCIDSGDLVRQFQKNDSLNQEQYYRYHRKKSYFDTSSTTDVLPSSAINFQMEQNVEEEIKEISEIPINVPDLITQIEGNPFNYYKIKKELGSGAYGKVFKVTHKATGLSRSMKILTKNNLRPGFSEQDIIHEINILKKLDHPNIIKTYEFYSDENNYYIINEFCTEGDLSDKVEKTKYFPECIVKVLMIQICSAVSYLHSKHIIHGDLKLENIMVDSSCSIRERPRLKSFISSSKEDAKNIQRLNKFTEGIKSSQRNSFYENFTSKKLKFKYSKLKNFDLKLIDFGCSKIFTKYKRNFEDTIGTLIYCSPEVLTNNYNEKCDIWSIGIIMYILLSGEMPFYGKTEEEITKKILSGKFKYDSPIFNNVSPLAKDLINRCLIYDKDKRIGIKEVLNHPFFLEDIDPLNIFQESLDTKNILISLKKYSKHSHLYQIILAFLSHNFADKGELDRIKKVFMAINTNLNGKITKEELLNAFKNEGIPIDNEQIENIMNSIDFNRNGTIEYEEFIRVTINKDNLFKEENLLQAFDYFDKGKKGFITANELRELIKGGKNIEESIIDELTKDMNIKEEEEINYERFKSFIFNLDRDKDSSATSVDMSSGGISSIHDEGKVIIGEELESVIENDDFEEEFKV